MGDVISTSLKIKSNRISWRTSISRVLEKLVSDIINDENINFVLLILPETSKDLIDGFRGRSLGRVEERISQIDGFNEVSVGEVSSGDFSWQFRVSISEESSREFVKNIWGSGRVVTLVDSIKIMSKSARNSSHSNFREKERSIFSIENVLDISHVEPSALFEDFIRGSVRVVISKLDGASVVFSDKDSVHAFESIVFLGSDISSDSDLAIRDSSDRVAH